MCLREQKGGNPMAKAQPLHGKKLSHRAIVVAFAMVGLLSAPAMAQSRHTISIGTIASTKACTTYMMASGKSTLSANRNSIYASESWRTWLVKDCVQNFPTMRTSLEAALASSGHFVVGAGGYRVNLTLSDVGARASAVVNASGYAPEAYASQSSSLFINIDVAITDKAGRVVYGGVLTKNLPLSSASGANEFVQADAQDGKGVYTQLQHEAALAAARVVIFHIDPVKVLGHSGNQIKLDYGQPILPFGGIVRVKAANGFDDIRFRVTTSDDGSAVAEKDGDGNVNDIAPGTTATFVENDSPAANARRFKREELP